MMRERRAAGMILIAAIALGALLAAAPAAAKSLGVVYSDGRGTENVPIERLEKDSEEYFVSAYDLARIFKATKFWNPGNRKLVLRIGSHRYLFTIDTRAVVVDETPVLMRVPVRWSDGAIMVPLEFVTGILAPRSALSIELDEKRMLLTLGRPEYNVTGIAIEDAADGTRAILSLTDELLYRMDSETPGVLRLKIYGGRLDPMQFAVPAGKGLLNRVRAEQTDQDAYLVFDVSKNVKRYRVEFEPSRAAAGEERPERRLVLFLERGARAEIPQPDFAGKRMTEMLEGGARRTIVEPVRTIVVDAGHGGSNTGRAGGSGVLEKDVNLRIALELRDRLAEELGVDVIMTRTEDVDVALDERVRIANAARAQLFVSVHCNGWFTSDADGFEVFFFAPARTAEEARLADAENGAAADSASRAADDIDFILWDMAQNEYISESSDLAETIQREMAKTLSIRNRGVKQAGLNVLRGLAMPGVLVETAFLSNAKEERLLQNDEFRSRVVEAIVEAVREFQRRYGAAPGG